MNEDWIHYATIGDSQYCGLDGINIWDYKWKSDYESVLIKDPNYGEEKSFTKFWIELENRKIEFVAGEFSNCIWGIYVRKNSNQKTKESLDNDFKIARNLINESDLLERIRNGAPENEYDSLTKQILSDILNKKGNKEIIENAFDILRLKYGEEKVKLRVSDFDSAIINLTEKIRLKTYANTV
ncbi:hypothetical protein [Formosa sp. S-31]|uniref:hypothetical protein n=1 Tax=Formosa sp. S-31 TaxID=2790949 RepID=UPI003EBCB064